MSRMRKLMLGLGVAAVVGLGAGAVATAGNDNPANPAQAAAAANDSAVAAQAGIFRRARSERDALPAGVAQVATAEASNASTTRALHEDISNSRRADPGTGRFGVWVVPATRTREDGTVVNDVCAHTQTVTGTSLGSGGEGCVAEADFATEGTGTVTSGGAGGAPGFAPHEAVVAGIVPDDITTVTLHLAEGDTLTANVQNNYYLFDTTKTITAVTYTGPSENETRPLDACQNCG